MLIRVLDAGHRPQLAHGAGLDARPALEREMHGAAACNLDEPGLLLIAQLAFERDVANEGIRWRRIGRASVSDADARAAEWPALAAGVHAQRHRGARAQARTEQVIGCRTRAEAADFDRLVGQESGASGVDLDLEVALARLLHHHPPFIGGVPQGL